MNIPEEAIRAAEAAAHDVAVMWKWSEMNRDESREFFAEVLAAAAPHLQAAAWDEGRRSLRDDLAGTPRIGTPGYKETPNPYKDRV